MNTGIKEQIIEILKNDIYYSSQGDQWVIHGAIEKLMNLFEGNADAGAENEKILMTSNRGFIEGYRYAAKKGDAVEKEQDEEILFTNLDELCVKFYYWWHNQKGTNTIEGFQSFKETDIYKEWLSKNKSEKEPSKVIRLIDEQINLYDKKSEEKQTDLNSPDFYRGKASGLNDAKLFLERNV